MANVLQVRTQEGDLERWKEAAWQARLSLTAWVRRTLDRAAAQSAPGDAKAANQAKRKEEPPIPTAEPVAEEAFEASGQKAVDLLGIPGVKRGSELHGRRDGIEYPAVDAGSDLTIPRDKPAPGDRRTVTYDRRGTFDQTRR